MANLREDIYDLKIWLYYRADLLDKETGDNKDDLLRSGQQAMALDIAWKLEEILKKEQ